MKMSSIAVKRLAVALVTVATTVALEASAALPTAVGTTITAIEADGQAIFALIFPVVGAFLGLTVVIKLFKRFSNKV